MHHLGAHEIIFERMPKPSGLSLGFWRVGSNDLSPVIDHNVGTIPLRSSNRETNTNSLIGMNIIDRLCLSVLRLGIHFVSVHRMRLMDTLARLNRMDICPGGWAVPQ